MVGQIRERCSGVLDNRARPSGMPTRTQMTMLRRISYICQVRLLCPIFGGGVAQLPCAARLQCHGLQLFRYHTLMYSYEYEWIFLCLSSEREEKFEPSRCILPISGISLHIPLIPHLL
jgi:hypothetical protein